MPLAATLVLIFVGVVACLVYAGSRLEFKHRYDFRFDRFFNSSSNFVAVMSATTAAFDSASNEIELFMTEWVRNGFQES